MLNKILIAAFIVALPAVSTAQLGGLMHKVKSKVNQRVDNHVDNAIDKTLNDIEGKPTAQAKPAATTTEVEEEKKEKTSSVKSYSKFDFVPGERILYAEDFAQDAVGELPLTWNSSGKGEVMTIEGKQGKWLRIFENNMYLTGNRSKFGENYTIEFDLMFYFEPKVKGYVLPGWDIGLFSSGDADPSDNEFLKNQGTYNNTEVHFGFGSYALAWLETTTDRRSAFSSDKMELGDVLSSFNKVVHYSIQVQKTRFRLWIDERKVFDIPRAINTKDTMNQIYFHLGGSNYQEDEIGLFVSNIKIATGLPDARHKLIEEGKFSTTGILFDFQSAAIKPESYGVLKEIATVLKENSSVNIKVVGHTSNDGDDNANMELSKQRAAAVKEALTKEHGIDGARIQTEGKGETQPVADNKTKEGKVQNRRVEFIKL